MKENEYEINGVWYNIKLNEMEFLNDIATQITELNFQEDTFDMDIERNELGFTKESQDFFNEVYDEIESLYINLIKNK